MPRSIPPAGGRGTSGEADLVEDPLRCRLVLAEDAEVEVVRLELPERGRHLADGRVGDGRILEVLVGEVGLRLRCREVLEEGDRGVGVRRVGGEPRLRACRAGVLNSTAPRLTRRTAWMWRAARQRAWRAS